MIQKLQTNYKTENDRNSIVEHEVHEIIDSIGRQLSKDQLEEVKKEIFSYLKENSKIIDLYSIEQERDVELKVACRNCFNAHIIETIGKIENIDQTKINEIKESLIGDMGHNGYYLNGDKLLNVRG